MPLSIPHLLATALSLALLAPTLLAYNLSPSVTLLNQLLAVAGWGGVLIVLGEGAAPRGGWGRIVRAGWPVLAALALLGAGVLRSWAVALPASLALEALGLLLAAAAVLCAALAHETSDDDVALFAGAMLLAALASAAVALVQVFAPGWADGVFIARSGLPGRAVGNLRQPNHLSSLLLWGLIALVPLAERGRVFGLRLGGAAWAALGAWLVLAVVLSASRTGLLGVLLLALWGGVDGRLSRRVRLGLLAAPLVYGLCWAAMAGWAHQTAHAFGAEARLSEGDISASRFGIWGNTLALIRAQPWAGVGFGEFNFAWSLTPFPGRPTAFFDHTHNLPLQLAVELGVPLAAALMGLLLWALWLAARRAWAVPAAAGAGARAAFMMVLMIGLHSLLEYPLWYAYFLLPAAWAWGVALRRGEAPARPAADGRAQAIPAWRPVAGMAMVAASAFALFDYQKVVAIYTAGDGELSLPQRIARGQGSLLFAHHADYAAATNTEPPVDALAAFASTTHSLLDTRLVMAWARALDEAGQRDKARYLAERLREFHNPDAKDFLAACDAPAADGQRPFQCEPSQTRWGWRDFLR